SQERVHFAETPAMRRCLLALLAVLALPAPPVLGQADDAAYCSALAGLARRYLGQQGEGKNSPDLDTAVAIDQCQRGNTAAGIPVLERKLRNGGFTLPKRS